MTAKNFQMQPLWHQNKRVLDFPEVQVFSTSVCKTVVFSPKFLREGHPLSEKYLVGYTCHRIIRASKKYWFLVYTKVDCELCKKSSGKPLLNSTFNLTML
jgi:hypothetical protein